MSDASTLRRRQPNRLILEKSPYLLEHAYNPVDWFPWGLEAFEKAKRENKLVFLSVGYSTCHWCHVMKRESFDDNDVARMINQNFVPIKVDKEERPDIDNLYMAVCQMISGNCGWPLTVVMTPDKKPFFAGTYFPKETRGGRIGVTELIPRLEELWMTRPEEILKSANEITATLKRLTFSEGEAVGQDTLNLAYQQLAQVFDEEAGGFHKAPKFPTPHNLFFLLRHWKRTGDKKALQMVERTLQSMRRGGIYDHVGFGFHRYSTDAKWLVPHFEKMLYDQALIAMAYVEAYLSTNKQEYKKTANEIIEYVLREMTSPEGGFYSAEDAESEGEEGKFYLWTTNEIRKTLGKEADFVIKSFNAETNGNFPDAWETNNGLNILHVKRSSADLACDLKISEQDLRKKMESIRQQLFSERTKRLHPHKDDKILTDWNGLMVAALAKAAQAFDEPKYTEAAKRATDFILGKLHRQDGRLLHMYRGGQPSALAYADDYAFLIWGLIELYEATFDARYLQVATELNQDFLVHFWDDEGGGFFFTSDDGEMLLIRKKEIYDGAIPSCNSVGMLNLIRLSRMTTNSDLAEKASRITRTFSTTVRQSPSSFTHLMVGIDFLLGPSYGIVISGKTNADDTKIMINAIRTRFLPNKTVLFIPSDQESPEICRIAESVKDQSSINGKATAYVCRNYVCEKPTTDLGRMLILLDLERTGRE